MNEESAKVNNRYLKGNQFIRPEELVREIDEPKYEVLNRNDGPRTRMEISALDNAYQTLERDLLHCKTSYGMYDTLEHQKLAKTHGFYDRVQHNKISESTSVFYNSLGENTISENVQTIYNTLEETKSSKPTEVIYNSLEENTTTSRPTEKFYYITKNKTRKAMWIAAAVLIFIMLAVAVAIITPLQLLNKFDSQNLESNLTKSPPSELLNETVSHDVVTNPTKSSASELLNETVSQNLVPYPTKSPPSELLNETVSQKLVPNPTKSPPSELLNEMVSQNVMPNPTKSSASKPITSCRNLPSSSPSGYYWVLSSNGSSIRVYCDMTRTCGPITGGWMRVTSLDMTTSSQCPSSLCLDTNPIRTCKTCNIGCSVENFSIGVSYSKVCGRVKAYQFGAPNSYSPHFTNGFDGVSFTYNSPDLHIWTFFAAIDEDPLRDDSVCPCFNHSNRYTPPVPSFYGNYYFCDTAPRVTNPLMFHWEDPLWDGFGCEGVNQCCSFNNPPWFYRDLSDPTTEDIKMKVCLDEAKFNEDLAIEKIDLYVQ